MNNKSVYYKARLGRGVIQIFYRGFHVGEINKINGVYKIQLKFNPEIALECCSLEGVNELVESNLNFPENYIRAIFVGINLVLITDCSRVTEIGKIITLNKLGSDYSNFVLSFDRD